ncbi:MAG: TetR/AcrR family transcriptional regulator [Gammaproteobacteria bacterium]|nr:TetR/AcrR family transcriptional regulator [Gammaproteobacteria bacterium]
MPRKSDKRERLVESAKKLMFQQGFNLTTLADIAQEADVPLGNVYYYFKTKEAIGEAVIAFCLAELKDRLVTCDMQNSALARLHAYLDQELQDAEWIVKHGDKLGSLCQELAKQGGALAAACANLLHQSVNWLQKQLEELGLPDQAAKQQARTLTAKVQGMNLLAATYSSSDYVEMLGKWLKEDLNKLSGATSGQFETHREEAYA